mgnify:CR=1 FL=1
MKPDAVKKTLNKSFGGRRNGYLRGGWRLNILSSSIYCGGCCRRWRSRRSSRDWLPPSADPPRADITRRKRKAVVVAVSPCRWRPRRSSRSIGRYGTFILLGSGLLRRRHITEGSGLLRRRLLLLLLPFRFIDGGRVGPRGP